MKWCKLQLKKIKKFIMEDNELEPLEENNLHSNVKRVPPPTSESAPKTPPCQK